MALLTGRSSDFLKIGVAAAGRGELALLRSVLAEQPQWLRRVGSHGRTLLWEAAYRGRQQVVEFLLDEGADIDAWGCHFTPLLVEISPYCAARYKRHSAVAEMLVERGAREDYFTALYLGNRSRVRRQIETRPALANAERKQHDPNVRGTALQYAVAAGHGDLVALLLEHGADPNRNGHWLVKFCVWRKRADLLKRLLEGGLDVAGDELPRSGVADPAIAALLAGYGIAHSPNQAEGGWPPIVYQCRGDRGGNVNRVRSLIEAGADVNMRNHKGQAALHCAAKAGFADIATLLLEHGADANALDAQGQTPLAALLRSTVKDKSRLLAVARLLVAAGANLDLTDQRGQTAKQIAARKRDAKVWLEALSDVRVRG